MAYLAPAEFAKKVVDAGESKLHMATRDVLIRAFMAGQPGQVRGVARSR